MECSMYVGTCSPKKTPKRGTRVALFNLTTSRGEMLVGTPATCSSRPSQPRDQRCIAANEDAFRTQTSACILGLELGLVDRWGWFPVEERAGDVMPLCERSAGTWVIGLLYDGDARAG